jgi:hypothetical protein
METEIGPGLVPGALHGPPDVEAMRLIAMVADIGSDVINAGDRACWAELWKAESGCWALTTAGKATGARPA